MKSAVLFFIGNNESNLFTMVWWNNCQIYYFDIQYFIILVRFLNCWWWLYLISKCCCCKILKAILLILRMRRHLYYLVSQYAYLKVLYRFIVSREVTEVSFIQNSMYSSWVRCSVTAQLLGLLSCRLHSILAVYSTLWHYEVILFC